MTPLKGPPSALVHGANADVALYDVKMQGLIVSIAHRKGQSQAECHLDPDAAALLAEKLLTWLILTGNSEAMKKAGGFMHVFGDNTKELADGIQAAKDMMQVPRTVELINPAKQKNTCPHHWGPQGYCTRCGTHRGFSGLGGTGYVEQADTKTPAKET